MIRSISLPLLVWLTGCAGVVRSYTVDVSRDEFEGHTYYLMRNNVVPGRVGDARVALNVQRFDPKSGEPRFSLIVDYEHAGWLFIEEGESLVLLVDGERMGFSGEGSRDSREVLSGGRVEEWAFYDVTPEQLRRIARATEIRMRLRGKWDEDRSLSPVNIERIRKFVLEYVPHELGGG